MRCKCLCTFLSLIFAIPVIAADTAFMQGLGDVRYQQIDSDTLGRPLHIYVSLPGDYSASEKKYPTIYLLDGGNLFPMLVPYHRYLKLGAEIPDSIIVGISYGSDDFEHGNRRSTDYTAPSDEREYWGGAGRFQEFLAKELMPVIELDYRSDEECRIIYGQSIGGQFVIYTALTRPELFWGHIASNPALHRNLPVFLEPYRGTGERLERSRLFVGSGTLDDPTFRDPAQAWLRHWLSVDDKPWDLHVVNLEGHSHMSAPPASFRQGLIWLFSGL